MNIKALNKDGVTPEFVAQHILEDSKDMDSIFVVAFTKDKGVYEYYSGNASQMALASLIMQAKALEAISG